MDDRYSSIKSNQNNIAVNSSFSYNYNSGYSNNNGGQFNIPESVLSDLCSRFIINMPVEERSDMIRMFFQIEIAHWFYLDFYCSNDDEEKYTSSSGGKDSGASSGGNTNSSTNNSSSSSISSSSEDADDYDEYDDANDLDEDSSGPKLIRQRNLTAAQNPLKQQLKPCSIRQFAENIFRYCPFLTQHTQHVDDILSKWRVFKHAVPTNGAIIMDEGMQHVLLVQGFWRNASWGFPKGKIFEEETESGCAVREVLEETGYDISSKLVEEEHLEININEQTIRLYIIGDVNKAVTKFEPRTRREIKEVRWFAIDDLPQHRKDSARCKQLFGYSTNAFFMVMPFVRALKKWISAKRAAPSGQTVPGGHVSTVLKNYGHHRHHKLSRLPLVTSSSGGIRVDSSRRHVNSNRRVNNNGQNSSYYNSGNYHSYLDSPSLNHASSQSNGFYKNQKSKSNENLFSASTKASPSLTGNSYNNKKSTPNQKAKTGFNNQGNKQMTNNNSIQKSPNSTSTSTSQSSTSFSFNKLLESLEAQSLQLQQQYQQQHQSPRPVDEQLQYFQQLQNKEYSELLNNKEAAVTALANKTNSLAFVNNNKMNKQQGQLKGKQAGSRARTVSLGIKDIKTDATPSVLDETSGAVSPRKQFNLNAPECWINFKFDYSALMQNLPPILDL